MPWRVSVLFVGAALLAQVQVASPAFAAEIGSTGDTPEAAIGNAVQSNPVQGRYAGSCETAMYPDDVGALCSDLVETRPADGMSAYLVSTFDTAGGFLYYVAPVDGGWRVEDIGLNYCEDGGAHSEFPAPVGS